MLRLRWSGEKFDYQVEIGAIADRDLDVGVPAGSALMDLVDSFLLGNGDVEASKRRLIEEAGEAGFVEAAAVFGNFEMMNRVAEGTGIPVPPQAVEREADLMQRLGLYETLKSQHRSNA